MSPMYGYTDAQLLRKENTALRSQVERYREALEQIANEDNCDSTCWGCGEWGTACRSTTTDTYPCAQALARDAIARLDADPPREPEA